MATATTETELKFEVDAGARRPPVEDMVTLDERDLHLWATYWDTDEHDLLRLGVSLRHRSADDGSEDEWTLKLGRPSDDDAVVRREITSGGPATAPPSELEQLVTGAIGGRSLRPVAVIETRRHAERLGPTGAAPVLEVVDDLVTSRVGARDGPSFREVEVELLDPEGAASLRRIGRRFRDAGLRPSEHRSKIARVVGPVAERPSPSGSSDSPVDVARASAGRAVEQLLAAEPLVRLGDDPDAVHDARVATRRLRSLLRALRPALIRSDVDRMRAELKWLGRVIGDLRDDDVLIARVRSALEAEGLDTADLLARLESRRELHHRSLVSALSGDRYAALVRDLSSWATSPPVDRSSERTSASALVRRRAARDWRRVRRAVRRLGDDPTPEQLHDVRKRTKRLRYTAQQARELGLRSKRFATRAEAVQDLLGDLHDDVVAERWLTTHVAGLEPSAAFTAGRLSERAAADARRIEASWHEAWDRLDRPRSTRWLH